ncbi:MAG: sulfatase [Cyclobacteriaceae bacterium]
MKSHINYILLFLFLFALSFESTAQKPNLLIIHTDEHNFRTLGCYRDQLSRYQAFIWGEGVEIKTPHIDRIASEGAICNNFYASSPVCTPSRASLVSGLYPIATGSPKNNLPMKDDIITFAEVLRREGYVTSYLGKWHLDGEAKPGFAPKRKFGFENNKYMFNRGHWKGLEDDENGNPKLMGEFNPKTQNAKLNVLTTDDQSFTTDYLTNKALEILDRDKEQPFCMMISLPDPHTPNLVRSPYDTMFNGLHFEKPITMKVSNDQFPKWISFEKNLVTEYEQEKMQRYFGMVKCIDDNVGRLLKFLDLNGLRDNTIVVFSSDHGDLMGEHKKHNKGNPYEASAKIPFIIRYPNKIPSGKVINKAFTTVDFTPTVLSLMNAPRISGVHGLNAGGDFLSSEKKINDDRITYITGSGSNWVCALNNRYKYILSISDEPWLFDLQEDPDEIINFYNDPEYKAVAGKMHKKLLAKLKKYDDPVLKSKKKLIY